jgi:hypothetical protein
VSAPCEWSVGAHECRCSESARLPCDWLENVRVAGGRRWATAAASPTGSDAGVCAGITPS